LPENDLRNFSYVLAGGEKSSFSVLNVKIYMTAHKLSVESVDKDNQILR
jgi:hypothetical protein